ncbi:ankyrin repeat-containing domain protein [Biscogniauxia sp. FL1348]|nr:ankyrin repeat-containing domain protein [Biscogniauxia sp. FL1348]
MRALESVSEGFSRIFILIDALDECQSTDGCRDRFTFALFTLQNKPGIKIFATSRFITDIQSHFISSMTLEIRAHEDDIQLYLEDHISQLPEFIQHSPNLKREIKTEICRAADGMFLLAKLHLDSLRDQKSFKSVRNTLRSLETGSNAYDSAYENAMKRIHGQLAGQAELGISILSWITCAKSWLTKTELQHALSVEIGKREFDKENLLQVDIVSVCAGLVMVNESNTVRLVHYTTQEYFDRTQKRWFPHAHSYITQICVTYLYFRDFEVGYCLSGNELRSRFLMNPLYQYAPQYWGAHAQLASYKDDKVTGELVLSFLKSTSHVVAAYQAKWTDRGFASDTPSEHITTGLHMAVQLDLLDIMPALLSDEHLEAKDHNGNTPLAVAAEFGHETAAGLLVSSGANVESKDPNGNTPLAIAAIHGHEAVVKLLLERGAVVNVESTKGRTPLFHTIDYTMYAKKPRAFQPGSDNKVKDENGMVVSFNATGRSGYKIAQLLLEYGAHVNAQDNQADTPLLLAVGNQENAAIRLLLERGADPEVVDKLGHTPLLSAVIQNNKEAVGLLLRSGANFEAVDGNDRTPLIISVLSRNTDITRLLLSKGANVRARDNQGKTALAHAAEQWLETGIQLLVASSDDIDCPSLEGETPLTLALYRLYQRWRCCSGF